MEHEWVALNALFLSVFGIAGGLLLGPLNELLDAELQVFGIGVLIACAIALALSLALWEILVGRWVRFKYIGRNAN